MASSCEGMPHAGNINVKSTIFCTSTYPVSLYSNYDQRSIQAPEITHKVESSIFNRLRFRVQSLLFTAIHHPRGGSNVHFARVLGIGYAQYIIMKLIRLNATDRVTQVKLCDASTNRRFPSHHATAKYRFPWCFIIDYHNCDDIPLKKLKVSLVFFSFNKIKKTKIDKCYRNYKLQN